MTTRSKKWAHRCVIDGNSMRMNIVMRRKRNLNLSDDEPVLDISSLIDVCFLLLIYFLVTSTIQPREQDLPMTLPGGYNPSVNESVQMLIGVKGDGSIVLNMGEDAEVLDQQGIQSELPETRERLKLMNDLAKSSGTELFVQIHTEENVSHQRFIDVLNCLRGVGVNQIAISNYDEKPL